MLNSPSGQCALKHSVVAIKSRINPLVDWTVYDRKYLENTYVNDALLTDYKS